MLPLKNNLAKDTHGFGYRIEEKNLSGIDTSCVTWEKATVNLSAEDVLIDQGVRSENRGKAEEFLMNELADGLEIPSNELYKRAEDMGISPKVLWSIKDKLGVQARKKGYQGQWYWSLPNKTVPNDSETSKIPIDSQINIGTFEESLI